MGDCNLIVTDRNVYALLHLIFVMTAGSGAAVGVSVAAWNIGAVTLVQQSVADEYRGRVFGAFGTTNAVVMLAGLAAGSLLGDAVGPVPPMNLSAALFALGGLVALVGLTSATPAHGAQPA